MDSFDFLYSTHFFLTLINMVHSKHILSHSCCPQCGTALTSNGGCEECSFQKILSLNLCEPSSTTTIIDDDDDFDRTWKTPILIRPKKKRLLEEMEKMLALKSLEKKKKSEKKQKEPRFRKWKSEHLEKRKEWKTRDQRTKTQNLTERVCKENLERYYVFYSWKNDLRKMKDEYNDLQFTNENRKDEILNVSEKLKEDLQHLDTQEQYIKIQIQEWMNKLDQIQQKKNEIESNHQHTQNQISEHVHEWEKTKQYWESKMKPLQENIDKEKLYFQSLPYFNESKCEEMIFENEDFFKEKKEKEFAEEYKRLSGQEFNK